jgi:uncharacterized ion transporter superfamily protein YfcC
MKIFNTYQFIILTLISVMALTFNSCKVTQDLNVAVYETSEQGNSLTKITEFKQSEKPLNFKQLLVLAVLLPKHQLLYLTN